MWHHSMEQREEMTDEVALDNNRQVMFFSHIAKRDSGKYQRSILTCVCGMWHTQRKSLGKSHKGDNTLSQ